ncbi:MAG: 23S rRNA (adenine(2503)-C(2))-methyltransferase RlmN [Desulfobacca sp.]|uniref:23S rRNA (adenine(2503)-C(2))-methyltransferase RlmN n=1 Tax=Desulfobacca sp. TaxID=2067990 RepID=UPI004048F0BC
MSTDLDLKDLTQTEFEELMVTWGQARFRARQVQKWLYKGVTDFEAMTDVSKAVKELLRQKTTLSQLTVVARQHAKDGCEKFSFRLADGEIIESVLIPETDHLTLCVSSQVGCAQGCRFCLTAQRGFRRQLRPAEIINQILAVRALVPAKPAITNLVFMGMGEPLANFANLVKALTIILAPWGLNFSSRRVTVSTVGLAPLIPKLGQAVQVNLAVSLNAPNDALRATFMPVARQYSLAQVLDACRAFPLPPHRRITFSYVLLRGINDAPAHARELAKLLHGLKAKINLIPFNPHPALPFQAPDEETVLAFQNILVQAHYTTLIRESRGADISAACGQLAGEVQ